MTPDIATLQIRILSDGVAQAGKRLETLEKQGARAERATDGLGTSFKSMAVGLLVPLGGIGAVIAGLHKIVQVTKEFGTLNAMLKTATGSAENAQIAFEGVQKFAAQTPYDLQQATSAFIKLVNYGLTPSTEALMAYGDFASSMGKPLLDMIEAVADATTGEMERLKEFGVKAKQEGDKVSFTFRGVTETVGRNSAEIEKYLIGLSQRNFGGAMAEQMGKLGGTLANLDDSWTMLFYNISEQGVGDAIQATVTVALDALNELNAQIASGELGAKIDAYAGLWADVAAQATASFKTASTSLEQESGIWASLTRNAVDVMGEAFDYFPANVEATMEVVGTVLYQLVESGQIAAETAVDLMLNEFDRLISGLRAVKTQIDSVLGNTGVEINLTNTISAIDEVHNKKALDILKNGAEEVVTLHNQTNAQIETSLAAREEIIANHNKRLTTAAELRAKYNQDQKGDGTDTLAQFGVRAPTATGGAGGKGGSGGGSSVDKGAKQLDRLTLSLMTEEEAIQESYDRRLEIIRENTAQGSELQYSLSEKLISATEEEITTIADLRSEDAEVYFLALKNAEQLLADSYEERKRIILESTKLTEEEKLAAMVAAETKYNESQRKLELTRNKALLSGTQTMLSDLASISGAFGKKGFKMAQAAAIANATIQTAESAVAAYKNGVIAGGSYYGVALGAIYAAAAVAAGAAQIATIKSTQYSGAYAEGGMIPAGKFGLVGEAGPEFVRGPAMVTSAKTTADRMAGTGKTDSAPVTVNVYNLPGQTAEVKENTGPNGEKQVELIIRKVEDKLTSDMQSGGGRFAPQIQRTFGLTRATR